MSYAKYCWGLIFTLPCALIIFLTSEAQAVETCFFLSVPCSGTGRTSMPSTGGAMPSYTDAFNLNPASIPTVNTSYGVEGVFSSGGSRSGIDQNYGLIKGFDRIGTGISMNSDNTFYGYNAEQALKGTSVTSASSTDVYKSKKPSWIFGGALDLFGSNLRKMLVLPTVGADIRYNRLTKHWDYGAGFSIAGDIFHIGVGAVYQSAYSSSTINIPAMTQVNFGVGAKISKFHLELTGEQTMFTPLLILTGTYSGDSLMTTAAVRKCQNITGQELTQLMASAQYKLGNSFRMGYLYGYLPGAHSLSVQWLVL